MTVTILSDLARNIRRYRNEQGISLTALAEKAGISKGYLSSIENGNNPSPGVYIVVNIADALEIDINQLVVRRSVTCYMRGHLCWYDHANDIYRYMDTDEPFDDKRKCPQCDKFPDGNYDACIGKLSGAMSVCCGHGKEDGYIIWGDNEAG